MNYKENHGNVGRALYVKCSPDKFKEVYKCKKDFKHGKIISSEELSEIGHEGIPVHIDENAQGDYECVCEFGVEIHYLMDYK